MTAGGTREPIDAVRFVGNRSSGRMGFALAAEAARRGAEVTVVAANVALAAQPGVRYVDVETAAELRAACARAFDAGRRPADGRGRRRLPAGRARRRQDQEGPGGEAMALELERTADVLSELSAAAATARLLVGFAAEPGEGAVDYGRDKLARKGLDAVVVNDIVAPDIGFDTADNEVTIVTAAASGGAEAAKARGRAAILDNVLGLRASRR